MGERGLEHEIGFNGIQGSSHLPNICTQISLFEILRMSSHEWQHFVCVPFAHVERSFTGMNDVGLLYGIVLAEGRGSAASEMQQLGYLRNLGLPCRGAGLAMDILTRDLPTPFLYC